MTVPIPVETPKILRILKEEGVKATFFVKGENVLAHPEIARQMQREGHVLANHTMRHERLLGLTPQQLEEEITGANAAIEKVVGRVPRFFRAPGGRAGARELEAMQRHGLAHVLWTDNPGDFRAAAKTEAQVHHAAREMQSYLVSHAQPGGILLLHDRSVTTVPGLRATIRQLKSQGYQFQTVEQMAADRPMLATRTDTFGTVTASRMAGAHELEQLAVHPTSSGIGMRSVSRVAKQIRLTRRLADGSTAHPDGGPRRRSRPWERRCWV
jgi:peptidoglycan/xylan/chitin deacetylase (PgdA/CDA1 family)